MRIGHGFDAHRFCEGDAVTIGGVRIAHDRGMAAHSDGDVLVHAICDALLGALGEGDIGRHFPDTDPAYRGIDSTRLLDQVMDKVRAAGYRLGNLDATVIAQAPRLAPHIAAMRARLAEVMDADEGRINIKATTTEKMGHTGRGEGIDAHAVVLLVPADA